MNLLCFININFKHHWLCLWNKNCPWQPYLLAEWDEMKKLYRGPYIDTFSQVWFHLAQLFQRSRLKYEKVNRRTTDAKWWQYLKWPFGSGELIRHVDVFIEIGWIQTVWPTQWHLSKLNLLVTYFYVWNIQVFSSYRIN